MLLAESFFFRPERISAVQDFFGHDHVAWFKAFSLLGETWGVMLAIGLALWLWGRETAYAVFFVVVVSVLVKGAMNLLVTVPRPSDPAIVVYQHLDTPSFPSGHVLTAVAMWALLYFRGRIHLAAALIVTILVCLGRIYLGSHYLIDVVVGAAAGFATAWAVAKSWGHVRRWAERLSFGWLCAGGAAVVAAVSVNLFLNTGIDHRWAVTGLAIGLIGGLLLEYWLSERSSPESDASTSYDLANASRAQRAGMIVAGAAGLGAAYAAGLTSVANPLIVDMVVSFFAALWITSAVPLLIARRG